MSSVTVTLIGKDANEVQADGQKLFNGVSSTIPLTPAPVIDTTFGTNWEQRIINLEGQSKVLYDRLYALESAPKGTVPQDTLDSITAMKTEVTKNKDSINQNHLDMNEFIKTHPSDTEMEAKLRILNDLITQVKTTQANAQLLINQNATKLATLDNTITPSNYRMMYRIIKGDGPDLNVTDNILTFGAINQMIELEETLSNEAADYEIVFNDVDPYPFYIPEYRNDESPLRARLKAGGLDFHVDGENAKIQIICTADPANIGHFEIRRKWDVVSK